MKNNESYMSLLEDIRTQDRKIRDLESENMNLKIKLHKYECLFKSLRDFVTKIETQENDEELDRLTFISDVFGIN